MLNEETSCTGHPGPGLLEKEVDWVATLGTRKKPTLPSKGELLGRAVEKGKDKGKGCHRVGPLELSRPH